MKRIFAALVAVLLSAPAYGQFGPGPGIPSNPGGGGGGAGTVTQIDTACGVSGGPITTTGTVQGNAATRAATGITDTVLSSDCGKVVTESNASPITITLPQATGSFGAGWFFTQVCLGAGTCTVVPTTSKINDPATSLTLTTGQSADIVSDGTNYIAALGRGGSPTTNAADLTSGTLAAARLPAFTGDCTTVAGAAATTCNAPNPGYIASNWYMSPAWQTQSTGNAVGAANRISCKYGYVPRTVTIGALGARIISVGTTNYQLAIYANSGGRPGVLLSSTGSMVTTATGLVSAALAANKQVGPDGADTGRDVWWCMNVNDTTTTFMAENTATTSQSASIGSATAADLIPANTAASLIGIHCTGANCAGGSSTFNTWPATLVGSTWTSMMSTTTGNTVPLIVFQAASVP
jgi:hypothetical protein